MKILRNNPKQEKNNSFDYGGGVKPGHISEREILFVC